MYRMNLNSICIEKGCPTIGVLTPPDGLWAATLAYVDDVVILLAADAVKSIVEKVALAASIAKQTYALHSLELNWKKGKTSVLLLSPSLDRGQFNKYLHLDEESLYVLTPCGQMVPVTSDYKYLGVKFDSVGPRQMHVTERTMIAKAANIALHPTIRRAKVDDTFRSRIFKAYYSSRLWYGLELVIENPAIMKKIQHAHLWPWLKMERTKENHYEIDWQTLMEKYGIASAQKEMCIRRLCLHQRVLLYADEEIFWDCTLADAGFVSHWREAVQHDALLLWVYNPKLKGMPSPFEQWEVWCNFLRIAGKQLRNALNWEGDFPVPAAPTSMQDEHVCMTCGRVCRSLQGLIAHLRRMHEQFPWYYWYVDSEICPVCHDNFETLERCRRHIARGHSCFCRLRDGDYPVLTKVQLDVLNDRCQSERDAARRSGRDPRLPKLDLIKRGPKRSSSVA